MAEPDLSGPTRPKLRSVVASAGLALLLVGCGGNDENGKGSASSVRDEPRSSEVDDAGATGDAGGAASEDDAGTLSGYTIDPPLDASAVVLPMADGSGEQAMAASAGGIHVVYFGYTSCPDVCPTTMSDLRRALSSLDEGERARVSVSMVTVDPGRDMAEGFAKYVNRFIDDGVALRTDDPAQLRAAADTFGADYEVTTGADGVVEVSHTGDLYAVDDQGRVVVQWPFGTNHESLERDLRTLLAGGPASEGE
jgi:protein SCO1/2